MPVLTSAPAEAPVRPPQEADWHMENCILTAWKNRSQKWGRPRSWSAGKYWEGEHSESARILGVTRSDSADSELCRRWEGGQFREPTAELENGAALQLLPTTGQRSDSELSKDEEGKRRKGGKENE